MKTQQYLQRYLEDIIFSQAIIAGYEISKFEITELLKEKKLSRSTKGQFVRQLQQAWDYVLTTSLSPISAQDIINLFEILNLNNGSHEVSVVAWGNLVDKWQKIEQPLERALVIFCDCALKNPCDSRMVLIGAFVANKVLLAHDLAILSIEPTLTDLERFAHVRYSNKASELYQFLVESCLHNYELDTIRKTMKTERLDCQLVKQT
ncbi:MAG: hypothetical protein ACRCZC_00720, partial [Culicoidibacterales bacterium]